MKRVSHLRVGALAVFVVLAMATQASGAERVRIAVFGLFHSKQLVVEALPGQPLHLAAGHRQMTLSASGQPRASIRLAGKKLEIDAGEPMILAEQIEIAAQASGEDSDFALVVPGKIRRQFHGRLLVIPQKDELLPAVEMDLEVAVSSIVAAESLPDVPLEALKAQAIVSRSYLVSAGPRHAHADFCDTTHCQYLRRPPSASSAAARATAETSGMVLAWQTRPFAAMYSASCGGRTRTLAEAGLLARDYPYFAVECPYCRRSPERWSSSVRAGDAGDILPGPDERTRIRTGRKLGWSTVPSSSYDVKRGPDGSLELHGVGHGHGIGLCERGAAAMARDGKDFRAILAYYFPNTTVQAH